jgi:hypothetical protein
VEPRVVTLDVHDASAFGVARGLVEFGIFVLVDTNEPPQRLIAGVASKLNILLGKEVIGITNH